MSKVVRMCLVLAAAARLGSAGAWAGESAPVWLDLTEGTRVAREVEQVAYSTEWDGGGNVRVYADEAVLKEASAPAMGDVEWNAAAAGVGCHVLTHESGGAVLEARFAVLGDDVVVHGGSVSGSDTWEAGKVHLVTAGVTVGSGAALAIESGAVVKFMDGTGLTVESGGSCVANGVVFTHVADDTVGGDTLMDGSESVPTAGRYVLRGNIVEDDATEERYTASVQMSGTISSSTRWRGHRVYWVTGNLTVGSGATLTVAPGAVVKFNSGVSLTVNSGGTLNAIGTRALPIVFTSVKDDEWGGDTNGDGDATAPQPGDWDELLNSGGTMALQHAKVLFGGYGAYSDQGDASVRTTGGTTMLDGCEVSHSNLRLLGRSGGTVTARNCVLRDGRWGWDGNVTFINGVVADCTTGANGGSACNTVFLECGTYASGTSLAHSLAYGATKTVQSGLLYADPLFADSDNGDFRIMSGSPCIDAGNGNLAPELDYWSQPRMDVEGGANTGTPAANGAVPDIGIHEYLPRVMPSDVDLAVAGVSCGTGEADIGGEIVISWTVENLGSAAARSWRDVVELVSENGTVTTLGEWTAAGLAAGGKRTERGMFTVPAMETGAARVRVKVNPHRDIFEGTLTGNNTALSEGMVDIRLPTWTAAEAGTVMLEPGGSMAYRIPAGSGTTAMFIGGGNGALEAYAAAGRIPAALIHDVAAETLADGRLLLSLPEDAQSTDYNIVLVNGGTGRLMLQTVTSTWAVELLEASPKRLANTETGHFTMTGVGLERVAGVRLDGMTSIELADVKAASPAKLTGTADLSGAVPGTYTFVLLLADGSHVWSDCQMEVYKPTQGTKLEAWLEVPDSTRQGRIYTGRVHYRNSGDESMVAPYMKISATNARMGTEAENGMEQTALEIIGISDEPPFGYLLPGKEMTFDFAFVSGNSPRFSLSVEKDDTEVWRELSSEIAYAANILNERGRKVHDFHVINEFANLCRTGTAWRAISGSVISAENGIPIEGAVVIATRDDGLVFSNETDKNGVFAIDGLEPNHAFRLHVQTKADCEEIVVQLGEADISGVSLKANCDITMRMTLFGFPEESTERVSAIARNEAGEERYVECDPAGVVEMPVPQMSNGQYLDLEVRAGQSVLAMECIEMDSIGGYFETAIDFAAPAVVSGRVVDESANPIPGTTIAVVSEDGVYVPPLLADSNGRFSISGLLPGHYTVSASREGFAGNSTNAFVPEEGTDVSITLKGATVYHVSGSCTAAPIDARAVLFNNEYVAQANSSLDGGPFDICVDATGDYTLVVVDGNLIPLTVPVGISISGSDCSVGNLPVAETRHVSIALAPAVLSAGRSYALADCYGYAHSGTVPADGTIIETLIPGTYTFSIALDDDEVWERDISVAEDSTFVFEIPSSPAQEPSAAIRGAISAGKATDWVQIQISTTDTRNFSLKRMRDELSRYENALATLIKIEPTYRCEHNLATYKEYTIARAWLLAEIGQAQGYVESIHQGNVLNGFSIAYDTAHLAANGFAWIVDLKEAIADLYEQGYTMEDILKVYNSIMAAIDQFTVDIARELQGFDEQLASLSDQIGIAQMSLDGKELAYENALKNQRSAQAQFNNYKRLNPEATSTAEFQRLQKNLVAAKEEFQLAKSAKTAAEEELKSLKVKKTDVEFKIKDAKQGRFAQLKEKIKGKFKVGKYGKIAGKLLGALNVYQTCKEVGDDVRRAYRNAQSLNDKREYFGKLYLPALQAAYERFLAAYRKAYHDNCRTGYYRPRYENTVIVSLSTPQSSDPNEMSGPGGAGPRRVVEPGTWATYTVYFENKSDAAAAAQEVRVALALDPALDWSTFEVGEVAFGGQIDNGLSGRKCGMSEAKQEGTAYHVKTESAFDEETGKAEWYLRIVDKTTADRWPKDLYAGILPPNDGTGRGEGHITYRVKVREDAAPGTVIRASASIVFDYNEAIETDPAWWNTVGQTSEVALSLGDGDEMSLGVVVGDAYGALPEPARTGWTFAGWWTGPGGTGTQVTPETIVSADTTALYAKWTRAVFDALWLDVTHGAVEIGTNGVTRGYGPEGDAVGGIAYRYYLTGTTSVHSVRYAGGSFTNTWTNLVIGLDAKDAVAVTLEGASVEVTLEGDSSIASGEDCAGVRVDAASALVLQGEGRLVAQGGKCGAGIGGGKLQESGRVEIRSGTVEARGGEYGAGIGGGLVAPAAREVVIAGGSVKARGSDGGEGIGGGFGREGTGAPVGAAGTPVHEVEVPLATDTLPAEVVVDVGGGKTYRYAGPGHEGDTSLWFWLPDGTYEFAADGDDYGAHVAGKGTSAVFTDPGNANFVPPPVGGVWNEDGRVRAGLNPAYRTSPFEVWTATSLNGSAWDWRLLSPAAYTYDRTNAVIRIPDDTNRMRMLRFRFLP